MLIIDVKNDYFKGSKSELHNSSEALGNIEKALAAFRKEKLPVIHVQHINTSEGAAFFLPDTNGTLIHEKLTPAENEYHVVKNFPSSFLATNLSDILKENNINVLVICGMMQNPSRNTRSHWPSTT